VEKDVRNRVSHVRDEIDFLFQRVDDTRGLVELIDRGTLPVMVIHNDTKYNNVMIDNTTGESLCVIDLDTVMRGSALFDFGDAVRSIANTAAEDEHDLTRVHFSQDIFRYFTKGYLAATLDALTQTEIDHLAFSARVMTLESGIRFLTDYLRGDVYFRTHRPNQNLDRSRTQLKLLQAMEENFDRMVGIVEDTLTGVKRLG
jgi:Ser/Thr protein kinase RdoA (MazF antagonist)